MATIYWPSTLPNPASANFEIDAKKFTNVLKFQSGRRRVVQNRIANIGSYEIIVSMTFQMTLSEYTIFAEFYDTYWKSLQPQTDSLAFDWQGQSWEGWPTTSVKATRSPNGWTVSFQMEMSTIPLGYSFNEDESHPSVPQWPETEFAMNSGMRFDRETRDEITASDEDRLVRTNIPGDNFVIGELAVERATFDRIFRLLSWWGYYVSYGAKPFQMSATGLDLGPINGRSKFGWYYGRFITPPRISFDGYFGAFSARVSIHIPNPDSVVYFQNIHLLITSDVSGEFLALDSTNIQSATDLTFYNSKGAHKWPPL